MSKFEKWVDENYAYKDSYDKAIAKAGWRAALRWVKKEAISLDERGDTSREIINRELRIPDKKKPKCDLCSDTGKVSIPCGDSFDISRGDTTMVPCSRCRRVGM